MKFTDLEAGSMALRRRAKSRKDALDALERLLRAHMALSQLREPESLYGILRPAQEHEIDLVEAVFLHCGVPLPDTLRAIYRRTLGIGNPISPLPVLVAPFVRAALPDEGFGPPIVGLEAFEKELGTIRDELTLERPPFLHLGHAAPAGLTVSRNGLWSIEDYKGCDRLPSMCEFDLKFEVAFCAFVEQVLLIWANDLAGAVLKRRDLHLLRSARPARLPKEVREALDDLSAPRALCARRGGDIQPIDNPDLLRATRRAEDGTSPELLGSRIAVVGLPYIDHPEAAARIVAGDLLGLRPVDDNPHDPDAVEVWQEGNMPVRVGFVSRTEARRVRALPHGPSFWQLRVTDRSDRVLVTVLEMRPADAEGLSGDEGTAVERVSASPDLFTRMAASAG